ncbi:hypothetical protein [Silvimonas soli]|uniref:hypothetical protein n=1 Tax=Silvimonas soli TaxID=2980100 RepID=UPI0024B3985B|nr:hypothetical protein [Silvimonas soli]
MKWILAVLLVANVAFLALNKTLPSALPAGTASHEINADKVHIVTGNVAYASQAASAAAASAPAEVAAATPMPTAVPTATPTPVAADATPTPTLKPLAQNSDTPQACLRWTGLTGDQADIARARIKALKLVATEQNLGSNAKVWVYIPPQPDLESAKRKAEQLAQLQIDDYFVVNNGSKWQNAISLGVYSTHDAGARRLDELRAKGVKSAVLRDKDDSLRHSSFVLKSVTDSQRDTLNKAAAQLKGTVLEPASCG